MQANLNHSADELLQFAEGSEQAALVAEIAAGPHARWGAVVAPEGHVALNHQASDLQRFAEGTEQAALVAELAAGPNKYWSAVAAPEAALGAG